MLSILLQGLGFALLLLGALPFLSLLQDFPLIALFSLAFVGLTVAGYEVTRRKGKKP